MPLCLQDDAKDELLAITAAVAKESTARLFANKAHESDRVVRAQRLFLAQQVLKASGIDSTEAYDNAQGASLAILRAICLGEVVLIPEEEETEPEE